jgi:ribosomal protein S18 acetylase RimI-like enzyme
MGVTEVRLGADHLAGCVALSAAAGWNQNAADWRLMLELGEGWGLELRDGTLVASTLVIPYGGFAWVSMVLVLPGHRRQGHATRLLRTALAALARANLTPVLDATPAGREVYRQEGFRDAWGFKRFVVQRKSQPPGPCAVRALRDADWPWIAELDRAAFGGQREPLLRALAGRLPDAALVIEGEGFILGREGREATQLGPLVASNARAAQLLLQSVLAFASGPLYLDLADHAALAPAGLAEQRPFTRMVFGTADAPGERGKIFLVAGPELG